MSTATPADRINLLLVDDHPLVIEGVKTLLKTDPGVRVVSQASSGTEALRRLRDHPEIQVALVDLNMPEMSGVELTRRIRAAHPGVEVLVLSMFHDHSSVLEVLEAGGAGYLLKNTTRAALCAAIHDVAAGRSHFGPEVSQTLLQNLALPHRGKPADTPPELTPREKEVLQLVAQEKSNLDIANQLFISERTVETHRKNMLTKTGCKSMVGLIQWALKNKVLA